MGFISKRPIIALIILYLSVVLIKISIAYFVKSPVEFADGYVYSKMARSIFSHEFIDVFSQTAYPPFYSLFLSVAYFFGSMESVYFAMKVINAFISSLIVIPTYFLAKEFLNIRKSFFITALVALLACNFNISNYIMAENLFYPLLMLSIYLVYKSMFKIGYFYPILSGISIGLVIMTKVLGFALLPIYFILFFIYRKRLYLNFKHMIAHYFSLGIVLIASFMGVLIKMLYSPTSSNSSSIYNILLEGFIGGVPLYLKVLGYLNWFVLYATYLVIASGILFSILFMAGSISFKDDKLKVIYSITFIFGILTVLGIVTAFSGFVAGIFDSRIIGRYIAGILPLILVLGYVSYDSIRKDEAAYTNKLKNLFLLSFGIYLVSLLTLPHFTLLPMNNQDVAYLGFVKYALELLGISSIYLIAAAFGLFIGLLFYLFYIKKINIIYLASFIIIVNTLLASSMTIYNATQWAKSEQYQLATWLDKYNPEASNVLIIEDNHGKINKELLSLFEYTSKGGYISYIGFWLNDNLYFSEGEIESNIDYVITKDKLDKELLYETSGQLKIKVYEA